MLGRDKRLASCVEVRSTGGRYKVARVSHGGHVYEVRYTGECRRILNPGERRERSERVEDPAVLRPIYERWQAWLRLQGFESSPTSGAS
jgi:hypothetical protein